MHNKYMTFKIVMYKSIIFINKLKIQIINVLNVFVKHTILRLVM